MNVTGAVQPAIVRPQRRLAPWQGLIAGTTDGATVLQKLFNGVTFEPGENACKLLMQLSAVAGSDTDDNVLTMFLALCDGVESPGLNIVMPYTDGVVINLVMKWGASPSSFIAPNGGQATVQPAYTQALSDGTLVGNEGEYNIGGRPDTSGALSGFLQITAPGTFQIQAVANLILWGE